MRRLPGNESEKRAGPCGPEPGGDISLDFRGKAPGRGAYLCPQTDCLRKAIKSKALDRGLNCQIPQEIYDLLLARMEAGDHD